MGTTDRKLIACSGCGDSFPDYLETRSTCARCHQQFCGQCDASPNPYGVLGQTDTSHLCAACRQPVGKPEPADDWEVGNTGLKLGDLAPGATVTPLDGPDVCRTCHSDTCAVKWHRVPTLTTGAQYHPGSKQVLLEPSGDGQITLVVNDAETGEPVTPTLLDYADSLAQALFQARETQVSNILVHRDLIQDLSNRLDAHLRDCTSADGLLPWMAACDGALATAGRWAYVILTLEQATLLRDTLNEHTRACDQL